MLDIAFKNVLRAKSRSLLTILSIAMGIGLIMALAAIGEGLNANIDAMAGDLAGTIDVMATEDDALTDSVIEEIRDMENVEDVIQVQTYQITRGRGRFDSFGGRRMGGSGGALFGGKEGGSTNIVFTGVNPEDLAFLVDENIVAQEGRKIDESDDSKMLVLMGYTTATSNQLNVGDEIIYERTENDTTEMFEFEVVGILEETTEDDIDQATYVPLSTMQEIEEDDTIESLKVKLEDVDKTQETTDQIQTDIENVRVMSILSMVERLQETLGTVQSAVYGIAAISLIVGGIGIMNTMVMTVMERRREIGVMKAIGATTTMVLTQILQESAILSLIGGVVGLALGYGATFAIESYTTFSTVVTWDWVALALGFSLALGMGAGLYPAYKASQLDPIEVLRYE